MGSGHGGPDVTRFRLALEMNSPAAVSLRRAASLLVVTMVLLDFTGREFTFNSFRNGSD